MDDYGTTRIADRDPLDGLSLPGDANPRIGPVALGLQPPLFPGYRARRRKGGAEYLPRAHGDDAAVVGPHAFEDRAEELARWRPDPLDAPDDAHAAECPAGELDPGRRTGISRWRAAGPLVPRRAPRVEGPCCA